MRKTMRQIHLAFVTTAFVLMAGCMTPTASKISGVRLGMTKNEVISVLGKPESISAQRSAEYMSYKLTESDIVWGVVSVAYYVRLVDGRVESFGRTGDFDSTKTPAIKIETTQDVKHEVKTEAKGDLYTELMKLKDLKESGLLTTEEFEREKKKLLGGERK